MTYGKRTCKILKEIRQQIADKNDIEYITSECHFQGECKGTCPKCEAELKFLEKELHKRKQLGKAVAVAGISLGIASTFSACNTPQKQTNTPISEQKITADTVNLDTMPLITQEKDIIEIEWMGEVVLDGMIGRDWEDTTRLNDDEYICSIVETMPEYIGGDEARVKFLQKNLVYPEEARKKGIEGRVMVAFVVEVDGSLTNFKILRSVHPLLDEEALRVVKMMPKWIPGEQKGKPVRTQFQIPITFQLDDE